MCWVVAKKERKAAPFFHVFSSHASLDSRLCKERVKISGGVKNGLENIFSPGEFGWTVTAQVVFYRRIRRCCFHQERAVRMVIFDVSFQCRFLGKRKETILTSVNSNGSRLHVKLSKSEGCPLYQLNELTLSLTPLLYKHHGHFC